MNIAQNADSGNKKKDFLNIIEHFSASDLGWQDAIKAFDLRIDNCARIQLLAQNSNYAKDVTNSGYTFALLDRVGREVACDLSSGNVCTLSTKSSTNAILNIEIINFLLSQNKPFEIIKGSEFIKLSNTQKSNSEIQYLIQIDLENVSYMELCEIISFCKTNFIFKIPGLNLNPKAEVEDEEGLGLVLCAFKAESNLIKHLVASLSEEEFVVISDGKPFVRSLVMEKSALLLENNQIKQNNQ